MRECVTWGAYLNWTIICVVNVICCFVWNTVNEWNLSKFAYGIKFVGKTKGFDKVMENNYE